MNVRYNGGDTSADWKGVGMKRLVIVGGGFAGVWAAMAAARVSDEEGQGPGKEIEITMISRDPFLTIRPRLYESDPETLRTPLAPVLDPLGAGLVLGSVETVDHGGHRVITSEGEHEYDRLILTPGSQAHAQTDDDHVALMSCQHAITMGKYAGHNAARDLLGLGLTPYRQERYVTCLDLGPWGAMYSRGWDREIAMTPAEAKARKRQINGEVIYPPTGDRAAILAVGELD